MRDRGFYQRNGLIMNSSMNLPRTLAELNRGLALGWHTGAQLYASLHGQTVADIAIGEARPGVPMAPPPWSSGLRPPRP